MNTFYFVQLFADWLTFTIFKINPQTILAKAVNFFIFDTIKIFILVAVIIFFVAVIRTFMPPDKIRKALAHKNKLTGHILAGLFGIATPFCTCSAIPLFLGFLEAGIPLGITFTFLVASPMINEVALILLWGMFGAKVAVIYIISGLVIAVFSGMIIGAMHPDKLLDKLARQGQSDTMFMAVDFKWRDRFTYARGYTTQILKSVWLYVLIGVGIGAWMHGYIPAETVAKYAGNKTWYSVPLAVLFGIPLYAGCAGVIPIVSVLTDKGVSLGTTLAFMMAVTGLSLPEFMILKRVMKVRLIIIFASVVGTGIIFTGYLFNFILK